VHKEESGKLVIKKKPGGYLNENLGRVRRGEDKDLVARKEVYQKKKKKKSCHEETGRLGVSVRRTPRSTETAFRTGRWATFWRKAIE